MPTLNYAAIDIGSNAVRLLIKSIDSEADDKEKFKKMQLMRVPLRLGFDIFKNGALSEKKTEKLRRLMKAYRQIIRRVRLSCLCHLCHARCSQRH